MLRKVLAVFLAAMLLLSLFAGCGAKAKDESGGVVKRYGDIKSRRPLRVCVDIQPFWSSDPLSLDSAMESFVAGLKEQTGLVNVVIEYLPSPTAGMNETDNVLKADSAVFRKTTLDRLRIEILSGGGPDVFVMTQMSSYTDVGMLFPFPEKNMESGLFLPLDDYMEDARFAQWDKFPKAILEAGRNDEGQQIIPLVYTLPVLMYPKLEFDYTPQGQLSWNDMISDPVLSPYAAAITDCAEYTPDSVTGRTGRHSAPYLEYILGGIADYENEQLLFTEAELLQRVEEILRIVPDEKLTKNALEMMIGWQMNSEQCPAEMTVLPLCNDDGGVSARITSYAAVNRNTQRPEEAFLAIDYLLDAKTQSESEIYSRFLCFFDGVPLHEDVFGESLPMHKRYTMMKENFSEFAAVRGQITTAHFETELHSILDMLLSYCMVAEDIDKSVEQLVRDAYEDLQRRVRE